MGVGKKVLIVSSLACGVAAVGVASYAVVRFVTTPVDETVGHLTYEAVDGGYKVTGLSNTNKKKIKSITVPNSYDHKNIVSIEKGAFKGCSQLLDITLPFIGENNDADYGDNALFGWVFGDEMYDDGGAYTWHNYIDKNSPSKELKYVKYVIPYTLESVTINNSKHIAPGAFSNCRYLESIKFNSCTATSIGDYAFNYCSCLYDFTLPNDVKAIEDHAFERCYTLQSMDINEGTTKIGDCAFNSCISLLKTYIPSSVTSMGNNAFKNDINGLIITGKSQNNDWPKDWVDEAANVVYDFNNEGFYYKDNCHVAMCGKDDNKYLYLIQWIGDWGQATITIPDSLTINGTTYPIKVIGANTFLENTNVITLNIGKYVESIGTSCFESCDRLTTINLPSSLKNIGKAAFKGCTNLRYHSENGVNVDGINLNNVTTIQDEAFMNCTHINHLDFSNNKITSIGTSSFENNLRLKELTLPNSIESLGNRAFFGCFKNNDDATTTTYPQVTFNEGNEKLKCIPEYCFASCGVRSTSSIYPRLIRVNFDMGNLNAVTSIKERAFSDAYVNYFTNVNCPNLTTINDYAFYNCKFLIPDNKPLTISKNITYIGKNAFRSCNTITGIEFEKSTDNENDSLTIDEYAFYDCANVELTDLILPDRLTNLGGYAFKSCTYLRRVQFPKNDDFKAIPTNAFNGCTYLKYSDSNNESSGVIIPKSVETIGSSAFANCSNIEKITCGADIKITSVGTSAFSGCSLLKTIENFSFKNVTSMGTNIFYNCVKLENAPVYEPSETVTYTTLPSAMYYNNYAMTSYDVNSCITKIDTSCFFNCSNLTTLTFDNSKLKYINASAFQNCAKLDFDSTNKLKPTSVGESSFSGCKALTNIDLSACSTIGANAFTGCTSISEITLRNKNNNSIGSTPFTGWTSSQKIKFYKSNIKNYSFEANELTTTWGWKLTKQNDATYRTIDCGSEDVVFEYIGG